MISRRALLMLTAALALSRFAPGATAAVPLEGLQRWGRGPFRRFGFLIYEATLWAGDDPQRLPRALRLDYKRTISGAAIAAASVDQMRRFVADKDHLQRWERQMRSIFPTVQDGDHIIGIQYSDRAEFYMAGRLLGTIEEPEFATAFFAIWLDPRTSAPELRAALLQKGEV